jgi:hypothetical protein
LEHLPPPQLPRAVQGAGAAILAPSTLALLSTSFPEGSQRTRAMAAYGALAGIGTTVGLIPEAYRPRRSPGATASSSTSRSGSLRSSPRRAISTRPNATPAGSTSPAR